MANNSVLKINFAPKMKNKMFKIMNVFYRTVFVLLGLDFGFFRHKNVPVKFFKLYSLTYCVTLNTSIYFIFIYRNFWQFTWFFAENFKLNLLKFRLLYLKDENSFYNFYKEIFLADLKSGIDSTSLNVELKILSFTFVWISLKFVLNGTYWGITEYRPDQILVTHYILMTAGSELLIITYAFMYYATCSRFKKLAEKLVIAESDFCRHQQSYKLYVDIIEKYKKVFDPTIIITLCCNIPEVMTSFYYTLVEWRYHTVKMDEFSLAYQYLFLTFTFTIPLIPAIFAGMISSQVQLIKLILYDKLMQKRDATSVWEIQRFICYVEARGCQFRVYKLIPLDASLVGMVIGFCVTYLIVIIQFTKLY